VLHNVDVGVFAGMYWEILLVRTISKRGTVTIPIEVRKKYGFVKGSKVNFVEKGGCLLVVLVVSPKDGFGVDGEK
jgi:bifunctional DNA-binding transcriptional regulator/antitoxin component of YhaV-PrlF toxin-antitoxin module